MNKVGDLDLQKQGLLTDTVFSYGNKSEGVVTVEPGVDIPVWQYARRE